ncbi:MAG: hypothetical protein HQL05_02305 [Nitrospirae bacterium]|uniref:hypothetical protein n=1 Tax=Candidatus Magnetobacterium casense TaxID=1455061 RepID=UPI00058F05D8|nr:hypothetical protein [Candidatus Magnetobacterium casensis]MBF0336643.1 hypothetical protein [Nitrospirota bacterium]
MKTGCRFPQEIRDLIIDALPQDTAVSGEPPDIKYTFIPRGHSKALQPDAMLVSGIRGAGKSFWWAVLQHEKRRKMVAHLLPKSNIGENTKVSSGFGETSNTNNYPGKDKLVQLSQQFDPRQIWRCVVLLQVIKDTDEGMSLPVSDWPDKVQWVIDNPQKVEELLYSADQRLDQAGVYHLILFDALDRTADDWQTMIAIIRGLLQVLLEFRAYRRIRPKAFVRPDHIEDASVFSFPDASKIRSQMVELRWPRKELYGMLWQYLANEPKRGGIFREGCQNILNQSWEQYEGVWTVPENMRINEDIQKEIFHAITGPSMGRGNRRGFPYTWLPNHLGDTSGQVSPSSFLSAIRKAAEDNPRSEYGYTLYYESIKKGVQQASQIRVWEMQEDYPWVDRLMEKLSGLTVPCHSEEITRCWEKDNTLNRLQSDIAKDQDKVKLLPKHLDEGPNGVMKDMESLGVFKFMLDKRVNIPDVYRIGYGLGRKGGVKIAVRE